jgi:hypothetical protein
MLRSRIGLVTDICLFVCSKTTTFLHGVGRIVVQTKKLIVTMFATEIVVLAPVGVVDLHRELRRCCARKR